MAEKAVGELVANIASLAVGMVSVVMHDRCFEAAGYGWRRSLRASWPDW